MASSLKINAKNGTHNAIGVTQSDGCVYVSGEFAMKPDVCVSTTTKVIEDTIREISKADAIKMFPSVWKAVKDADTDMLYAEGGQGWSDLMDDIILFYVCRFRLFGLAIPCLPGIPSSENPPN